MITPDVTDFSAEARARHLARRELVIGFEAVKALPEDDEIMTLPVGPLGEEGAGTDGFALFVLQFGVPKIWLPEWMRRGCGYIHFKDGLVDPCVDGGMRIRPLIGGTFGRGGYAVRCGLDARGMMHLALPTAAEADAHIIWYRMETPEEWQGSPDHYEHGVQTWREVRDNPEAFSWADGWYGVREPRTNSTYFRRKRQ